MQAEQIRLIIADDHLVVLDALTYYLERHRFNIVGKTHSGREALRLVEQHEPDVLILDLSLPDLHGHKILTALQERGLSTRVLVLSSSKDARDVALAMQTGAAGYISKDMEPADFLEAILQVAAGDRIFERQLLDQILSLDADLAADGEHGLVQPLTEQEMRVLILMTNGMSNPEIADLLAVSANTIKTHVRHIFEKIGVSDRTSAALWAAKQGLFPPGASTT